jgi:hypothetical protein
MGSVLKSQRAMFSSGITNRLIASGWTTTIPAKPEEESVMFEEVQVGIQSTWKARLYQGNFHHAPPALINPGWIVIL